MSLLDLLIVLTYLLLVAFGRVQSGAASLVFLLLAIIVVRVIVAAVGSGKWFTKPPA